MEIGEYYEIAKENTVLEILKEIQSTKEAVQNIRTGGIPPANMRAIGIVPGDGILKVTFTEPTDTVIEEQLICTVKGCMVRIKQGGYPENETDGDLVVDNTELGKYSTEALEVTGLENNVTYYLSFFPYNDQGLYNYNQANRMAAMPQSYVVYGYKINKGDSNPETRITYTESAVGMTPAHMDYTAGAFDYGSWAGAWFVEENKPYMVKGDGTVDYELDASDYTKKADGTASDVANTAYNGNAMASFPLVWFKRWEDEAYEYCNICNIKLDDSYKAYAHTRKDGSIMDVKYLAMFEGSYISNKMRSLSGQDVGVSQTADTEISYATANGERWYTQSFSDWQMVGDLLRLISRSDNSQATFGFGFGSNGTGIKTGTLTAAGQFFGTAEAQSMKNAVKVFHIENFWGNTWNRIAGFVSLAGKLYYKETYPYNAAGSGYTYSGIAFTETTGGYSTTTKMLEAGRIATDYKGSGSTYATDGAEFEISKTNYAVVGGSYMGAWANGAFAMALKYTADTTATDIGACLSCEQPA